MNVSRLSINKVLSLDHFFLMVNPQLFEQLKDLQGILKNTLFDRIERPDAMYEGIYVFAKNRTYLEFLNTAGSKYAFWLGIGWSSKDPRIIDVDSLPEAFPDLEWQTFAIKHSNNEPWYDAYIPSPVEVSYHLNFTSWGVKYHTKRRTRKSSNYSIEKFVSLRLDVPETYLKLVTHSSQWFPTKRLITEDKVVLEVPQGKDDSFRIFLYADSSLDKPKSVELRARKYNHDLSLSEKLGSLTLYTNNEDIVFQFSDL